MNIKEYISSGILELYAAGSLSEKEMREVEQVAASYTEVKAELDAINNALAGYVSAYKKNPRPDLRQKVLDRIEVTEGDSKIIPLPDYSQRAGSMRYLMAAIAAFIILNVTASVYLYIKLQGTEKQMAVLVDENKNTKSEYEKIKQALDKKSTEMQMAMNKSNKMIELKGMEASPGASATVIWNPNTRKVMLNVEKLPMPPAGMQYQLWAMNQGKHVDAGVFDMTDDPMHMMDTPVVEADAFAITLEKMGGSKEPTMTNLYAMGKL